MKIGAGFITIQLEKTEGHLISPTVNFKPANQQKAIYFCG
jgi:hypothetical protein